MRLLPPALILLAAAALSSRAAEVDFASQIQPLLARHCYACHGPDDQQGGLRFDDRRSLLAQADSGQIALVPGQPDQSELLRRVAAEDPAERMPPESPPLGPREVELLRGWIESGAEYSEHWAFQPIERPAVPPVQRSAEATGPLDMFVLHKLERAGVPWVGAATPAELVRRLYLDVIGLPPAPEELNRWLTDWDDERYEQLVDQLLADPALGERWARMWLDVVRYAESNSFERDNPKPHAWKYRDYVIRAFNNDKPYDRFVREQIAGDELDDTDLETLTATGYYRLGIWDDEPADPLQAIFDEFDDLVSTTGQAFLGLTVGCARCHDHKIDPITQRDYYALLAFMRDVTSYGTRADQESNNQIDLDEQLVKDHKQLDTGIQRLQRRLRRLEQAAIETMPAPDQRATEGPDRDRVLAEKLRDHMDDGVWQEYSELKQELADLLQRKASLPARVTTLGLARLEPRPPTTFVLRRGSPHNAGEPVEPAFPEVLGGGVPQLPAYVDGARSAGRRRLLADWLASTDNWLTARVIVNRIWLHYFGRGIVRSPNNFGLMGDPPTHPDLLDYLACELMDSGWSLKQLHRQILLSSTYRRSTQQHADSLAADPANQLFWRQNLRRLSAEQIRDGILKVSGQLDSSRFGPPIYPQLSAEVLASQSQPGRNWEKSSPAEQARRSVYIHVKRSLPVPMLSVFDFPETDSSCEARFLTVQPGQALTLLNSQWMQEQAQALLERVQREVGSDLRAQAARCLELVGGRPGPEQDVQTLVDLVQSLKERARLNDQSARRGMCLVALNLNQFLFIE